LCIAVNRVGQSSQTVRQTGNLLPVTLISEPTNDTQGALFARHQRIMTKQLRGSKAEGLREFKQSGTTPAMFWLPVAGFGPWFLVNGHAVSLPNEFEMNFKTSFII
jgi:hypothetical protein